ncbi:uncharacterized protein LOC119099628 [Pollicipes pollicipes]|uniref:uncharacterized protein LOC119099628 n=1 Tax=Pollicipes pollicipes TaxID=41117 RepID=UPI001884C36F|nr:uncharacterized protein LOC119099628 [Pollicipes pollicipes]
MWRPGLDRTLPPRAAGVLLLLATAATTQLPCQEKYFSLGRPPRGAPFVEDARRVGLCQRYHGADYYFTLFDTRYRIPVYSAYVPAPEPADGARSGRRRTGRWYVEHSLAEDSNGTQGMDQWPGSRGRVSRRMRDQLPRLQAVDDDYAESGFNRGHLNPNFLQDGKNPRLATFTLTNAVPQEPCFNQGAWKRAEQLFDDVFVTFCYARNGSLHALTGAVPNYPAEESDLRTTRTISCGDNEGGCSVWRPQHEEDMYHRVNIPSRMWTAACCRYMEDGRQMALPYLHWGLNARDGIAHLNVGGHELRHFELQLREWHYAESGGGELDPLLLHAMGRQRRVQQLTNRIYGLLATGRYFVKCVDPLDSYVHSHEANSARTHHTLASPYCSLSMSYEPDDPIPDLNLVLRLSSRSVAWTLEYAAHAGALASGDTVLLVDRETCVGLTYPHRRRGWPHGHIVGNGARVRLRTAHTTDASYDILYSSYTSNIYYDRFDDSSKQLWRVGGLPRHGGQITLENVRFDKWYLALKDSVTDDGGVFKGKLCTNHNKWLVYKLPATIKVEYGSEIHGFETMVRNACAPGENKPLCTV